MNANPTRPARIAILLTSLAMAFSAAAVQAQSDDADGPTMSVEVTGLNPGESVTGNRIDINVQPVGYELSPDAGTPPVDGKGHYHVILDGGLVNMFSSPEASLSLQNVAPGPHTLMVLPAMNDHTEVMEGAAAIEFDYQPTDPLPEISASGESGAAPTISIVSPAPGETVGDSFDLVVSTTDFTLSDDLLGRPNIEGYGHWHVFVDAAESMGTMTGMSGTDSMSVSTAALSPGTHTLIAVLVDNLHAPFDPAIAATVDVEVVGDSASVGEDVAISLGEFTLSPADVGLKPGTHTFVASNDGTIAHALALAGEGISTGTPDAAFAAGTSQSFSVDLAAGTYEIYCPIPGHKDAGMVGTVTVSA